MLHAGLRFPLAPELLKIFRVCGVPLAQFLCRAVIIIVGLMAFYREHGARLTVNYLSKMCRLTSDSQGRILCRGLSEKWGRLKELPDFPHLGEEEILKTLNFSDTKSLQEELRHISQFVMEEKLFKVGLSIQAGRSHAVWLKKSEKVHETSPNALRVDDAVGLPSDGEASREVIRTLMINITTYNSDREIRPLKIPIPEEMIQRMDVESQFDFILDDWNTKFVNVKYLQGDYKQKLDIKIKEMSALKNQLAECRTELVMVSTTFSLQNREAGRSRTELIEASIETNQKNEVLKALTAEKNALEITNKELQDRLLEKEEAILNADARTEAVSLEAVEKFKKSSAYHREIQNHVQETYNKLFDAETRNLERQCLEEGFVRGFLKGARLVQCNTGVTIEGLSPSQASKDPSPDLDDDDAESELRNVLSSDDEDVEIM
ncbi:hypothetical protein IEQ34_026802 [Dendrobium chrysotoxum]|uniref:Uncharacterized protein n=1 Tax=Dendrobium chrysotoxum TaxID=161865 RepID=A0AAV7FL58_DENCH|nr:hypothetical protein IEQ34_026802 [Dendrobium chrysotoxum]